MTGLLALDRALFEFINTGLSNPVFDAVLPWVRERLLWAPLYVFMLAFTWFNFRRRFWGVLLGAALVVALADSISSELIKKNVRRLRPCNDPALVVRERVSCGSGFSFTSSHAANHFGAALFLIALYGRRFPWIRPALLGWATAIALAQVYVGLHYPGDVLCGGLLGAGIGWGVGTVWRRRVA
jgi:membrane-associated phospholipid phosphatase